MRKHHQGREDRAQAPPRGGQEEGRGRGGGGRVEDKLIKQTCYELYLVRQFDFGKSLWLNFWS